MYKKANRDITKVSYPEYQQTIFDYIEHELEFIDDNNDVSVVPEPIQLFLGYNSPDEGALRSILQLYKKEGDSNITITYFKDDFYNFLDLNEELIFPLGKIKYCGHKFNSPHKV